MANFIKVAHRGASGSYPENTRVAFEKAIEARVDMIEADCQLTQDGHVVVFHDERLNRTAKARGTVKGKTLAQLKKLDVGSWRKKVFKGERMLTVEELLDVIDGKADLCLDIKHFRSSPMGIELKLLFILSHYDYLERTILSSFDYRTLGRVRELAPDSRIGVIYGAGIKGEPLENADALGAQSLHVQKEFATGEFLERARRAGRDIYVWTVNEVAEMEKWAERGVRGIISDYPEKFWKLKTRKK